MKTIQLIVLFLLAMVSARAGHLVGGELTYEYLGGDEYEFTLTIYRDCATSQTDFDAVAAMGIFDGNGNFIEVINFPYPQTTQLATDVEFDCDDIEIDVCIIRGITSNVISLPANANGYWVAYQRCCRNPTIVNIETPGEAGNTYAAFVPSRTFVGDNSSPSFNSQPPIGLCQNYPVNVDLGATDTDGDSLVYAFCTPYTGGGPDLNLPGGDPNGPQPNPPLGPDWGTIVWEAGYSAEYPVSSDPGFALDPETGQLTGIPDQVGQYVVGICVREYRNGDFLSEIRRDFQFNITLCPNIQLASFANFDEGEVYCLGESIAFENLSVNADTYDWYFGDGSTSNEEEPIITFNDSGVYDVMLVINSNEACPDTALTTYLVSQPPTPTLLAPVLNCPEETYDIEVIGEIGGAIDFEWTAGEAVDFPDDAEETIQGITLPPGDYPLEVVATNSEDCSSTSVLNVNIPAQPEAAIQPITDPCQGLTTSFVNLSLNGQDFVWTFGDPSGANGSTEFSPIYAYPQAGEYTTTLTVTAPNTCVSSDQITFEVNPEVNIEFAVPEARCTPGNVWDVEVTGDFGPSATIEWEMPGSDLGTSNLVDPPLFSYPEQGAWPVTLLVTEGPCSDTQTSDLVTIDPIEADFMVDGESCAPYDARFFNETTGGGVVNYHWDFGNGTTSITPSPVYTYTGEGQYTVTLTAESTFGCPGVSTITKDTVIQVFDRPTAGFLLDPPVLDINSPVVEVTDVSIGSDRCLYLIEGDNTIEECDFTYTFREGGEYEITQLVFNDNGCDNRVTQEIKVLGHAFYAPNAITLNQDGLNDFFLPVVSGDIVEYSLKIYDRWGGLIFETDATDRPWVPDYAHQGLYIYDVLLRDNFDFTRSYRGSFHLIR